MESKGFTFPPIVIMGEYPIHTYSLFNNVSFPEVVTDVVRRVPFTVDKIQDKNLDEKFFK